MSDEPMTPTAEVMVQLHEMFTSMLAADFTEMQACTIIGVMLANGRSDNGE